MCIPQWGAKKPSRACTFCASRKQSCRPSSAATSVMKKLRPEWFIAGCMRTPALPHSDIADISKAPIQVDPVPGTFAEAASHALSTSTTATTHVQSTSAGPTSHAPPMPSAAASHPGPIARTSSATGGTAHDQEGPIYTTTTQGTSNNTFNWDVQ
jgi:hypothetical protein